jgi:arabinofuranosyltransferase
VVCAGWLRFSTGIGHASSDHGIVDERTVWVRASKVAHPVTAADYHNSLGHYYREVAATAESHHRQVMFVLTDLGASAPVSPPDTRPARSSLPFSVVISLGAIGVTAYLSGPDVYVFDTVSLANPVGSHFIVVRHGRPGHEKLIGTDWMFARFGIASVQLPTGVSAGSVASARRAMACAPLSSYLHAITAPLGLSQAIVNIAHSLTYTTMKFNAQPQVAEQELCG